MLIFVHGLVKKVHGLHNKNSLKVTLIVWVHESMSPWVHEHIKSVGVVGKNDESWDVFGNGG